MLWEQTEHQQTRLRIKNGGAIDYTAINYSTVKITFPRETRDSAVKVSDALHVWFELFPAAGTYDLTFPEKRRWADWVIDIWPNTTVEVTDSYLYERDVSISDDTHISVYDTPSGFSLGWAIGRNDAGSAGCELTGLGDPYDDNGVSYEDKLWDLPCNNSSLRVRDSVLQRAWPVTWGQVKLTLRNSNLVDPRVFGGPATMEIYDSTIDHIAAYQEGRVYIENSQIRRDVQVNDPNSAIYVYQVSNRDEDREIEVSESGGGTYVELDAPGPPW